MASLETRRSFLDRPIPMRLAVGALAVLFLNLVDAFGTLRHIAHGAEELNPIMAHLLDSGPVAFVLGKHALAALGVIGILAHDHKSARRIALFFVLLPTYAAVAVYQASLFYFL